MPTLSPYRAARASTPFRPTPRCPDGGHQRLSRDGRLCRVRVAGLWDRLRGPRGSSVIVVAALSREHSHAGALAAGSPEEKMTRKQQRLGLLALGMAALGGATVLVLSAFNDNLVFFYSPSELKAKAVAADRRVRIGGLVEARSLSRDIDGRSVSFP